MLVATVLLYSTSRYLFGYWPSVTAAALFASLGITQALGAYATFDAMALALMAFAVYCAVRAVTSSAWLLAIPVVLFLANASKYACVIFDPVVITVASLMLTSGGWRRIALRAAALSSATAVLTVVGVVLAGTAYLKGILFTTIARKTGTGILNLNPASTSIIVRFSWGLIGLVVVIGAAALLMAAAIPQERKTIPLLAVLLLAGLLVTLEAIRLQDLTSVNKHDDFGAWFAVMPAGYALARGVELVRRRYIRVVCAIPAIIGIGLTMQCYTKDVPIDPSPNMRGTGVIVPYLRVNSSYRYLLGGSLATLFCMTTISLFRGKEPSMTITLSIQSLVGVAMRVARRPESHACAQRRTACT